MKRLVYSPSIKAWVKTDSGIVDLSPYIVNCRIERKVDDVSNAELEFRNPKIRDENGKAKFLFTEHMTDGKVLPVFHPMDPITIVFERIGGKPIQVFTGYCDTVPDVQLFPGTAKIKASCTLKRLLYTYWDPALPFVVDFMSNYGWNLDRSTGQAGQPLQNENKNTITKVNKLNDSTIGNLLYAVLHEIGGWDDSNIYIQPLPSNIGPTVAKLLDEFTADNKKANEEVSKLMQDIVGAGRYGSATAGGNNVNGEVPGLSGPVKNERQIVTLIRSISNQYGVPADFVLAVAIVETDLQNTDDPPHQGWFQFSSSQDYVGQPVIDVSKAHDLGYATAQFCKAAKAREKFKRYGYATWARSCQLNPSSINNAGMTGQYGTFNPNPDGNARYSDGMFPGFVSQAQALLRKYP